MMLCTSLLALLLPAVVFAGCRPGWQGPIEGTCFKNHGGNHRQGVEYCKTQASYLYRPDTKLKEEALYKMVKLNYNGCGPGHYTPVDATFINGKWRWGVTGHLLKPQPAHPPHKDCLIQRQPCSGPYFDAVHCNTAGAYFCADQIGCPTGWQGPVGGECFKHSGGTHAQALHICRNMGSFLYRPDTPQKETILYNMVKANYHGCSSGHYTPVDATFINGRWRWGVTGEELNPQPAHPAGKDCLVQRQPCSGPVFDPVPCSTSGAIFCSHALKPKTCPVGWQGPYGGECMKHGGGTHAQAVAYCGTLQADLYRPDTPEKENILYTIVKENYNGCSSGHYTPVDARYINGKWRWGVTGVTMNPQPAHPAGKDCLIQRQPCNGPYFDPVPCTTSGAIYCAKPLRPKLCSSGWQGPYGGMCFKNAGGTHMQAVQHCQQLGARLYRPDTTHKETILYNLVKMNYNGCGACHYVHVDAKFMNGKWRWTTTGAEVSPQPLHGHGRECLIQRQPCSGPYFDGAECTQSAAFFCAK